MISALVGHLVGDYLLQNDWMALNKKKNSLICLLHAFLWTLAVCAFAEWWYPRAFLVLLITHFLQDRTNFINYWMDCVGQYKFRTGPLAPWSSIAVDNVFHIVTIWVVWKVQIFHH